MTDHPRDEAAWQARSMALLSELGAHLATRWPADPRPVRGNVVRLVPACASCAAWEMNPSNPTSGLCRRTVRNGDRPWPVTLADEWCAAYTPPDLVTMLYGWTREPARWVRPCSACDGTGTLGGGPCGTCDGQGRHLTILSWWLGELALAVGPYLVPDVWPTEGRTS